LKSRAPALDPPSGLAADRNFSPTPTTYRCKFAKPRIRRQQNPLEIVKMRVVLVSGGVISGVGKGEFPLSFCPPFFLGCGHLRCSAPSREHKARVPLHEVYFYLAPRSVLDATRWPWAWHTMTAPSNAEQNRWLTCIFCSSDRNHRYAIASACPANWPFQYHALTW